MFSHAGVAVSSCHEQCTSAEWRQYTNLNPALVCLACAAACGFAPHTHVIHVHDMASGHMQPHRYSRHTRTPCGTPHRSLVTVPLHTLQMHAHGTWPVGNTRTPKSFTTQTPAACGATPQVTGDGTIYVGHQDTTVKKYLPISAAAAAEAAGTAGVPFSPRATGAGAAAAAAGSVRQPDAQTVPSSGHVGPVNDLVACGSYICSAGGAAACMCCWLSQLRAV